MALGQATASRLALSGLLCGLAFEARYQTGLMGLGLFTWLVFVVRTRIGGLAAFLGGGLAALRGTDPSTLSVTQLRRALAQAGVSTAGCVEKADLVDKVRR